MDNISIIYIGDETTMGVGSIQSNWTSLVDNYIKSVYRQENLDSYISYNLSVYKNDTTRFLKDSQITEIKKRMIPGYKTIVVLNLGLWDSVYKKDKKDNMIKMSFFADNYRKILDSLESFDKILAITPIIYHEKEETNNDDFVFKNQDILRYSIEIENITKEYNVPCLNFSKNFTLKDKDTYNGIYPNTMGHHYIADKILDFLKENIDFS